MNIITFTPVSKTPAKSTMPMKWTEKDIDSSIQCVHCGRYVNLKSCRWIEVINGGNTVCLPGTADTEDAGYMGYYPIGSTCEKKFKGFSCTKAQMK